MDVDENATQEQYTRLLAPAFRAEREGKFNKAYWKLQKMKGLRVEEIRGRLKVPEGAKKTFNSVVIGTAEGLLGEAEKELQDGREDWAERYFKKVEDLELFMGEQGYFGVDAVREELYKELQN